MLQHPLDFVVFYLLDKGRVTKSALVEGWWISIALNCKLNSAFKVRWIKHLFFMIHPSSLSQLIFCCKTHIFTLGANCSRSMGLKPKFLGFVICQKHCPWWFSLSKTVRAKGRQWTSGAEHQQPEFCSWFPEQSLSDLKEVISPLCQFYSL